MHSTSASSEALPGYPGGFNDGRSAARHPVTVSLAAEWLTITSESGVVLRRWTYADLATSDRLRREDAVRLFSRAEPDARLTVADRRFFAALRRRAPGLFESGLAHRAGRRRAALIAIALAGVVLAAWYGVPALSQGLVHLVPGAWEQNAGRALKARMVGGDRECERAAGTAALRHLTAALTAVIDEPPDLTVSVVERGVVNAFALPGGQIVLFSGLIDKAGAADEVASVLAHEIGHEVLRHPLQALIRHVGVGIVAELLTGDGGGVAGAVGEWAGLLLLLSYSRDMEREADAYGRSLLRRSRIGTAGMARFFERLDAEDPNIFGRMGDLGALLSTHPDPHSRSEEAERAATADAVAALTPAQWAALRSICD